MGIVSNHIFYSFSWTALGTWSNATRRRQGQVQTLRRPLSPRHERSIPPFVCRKSWRAQQITVNPREGTASHQLRILFQAKSRVRLQEGLEKARSTHWKAPWGNYAALLRCKYIQPTLFQVIFEKFQWNLGRLFQICFVLNYSLSPLGQSLYDVQFFRISISWNEKMRVSDFFQGLFFILDSPKGK